TGLLPGKAVALGDTWKVADPIVQALCNFEGMTEQNLVGKLASVKGGLARVTVSGTATGIDLGALAKLTIEAVYEFDLQAQRLGKLEWKQKDERQQGPASPAESLSITTNMVRTIIEQPATLSDVALVSVPDAPEPPPSLTQLDYRDPNSRF